MSNAGVNCWSNTRFHHQTDVDSGRHPLIIKSWNCPFGVLCERNLTHGAGKIGCTGRCSHTDETSNGWCRCHGKPSKPDCLDNGGVPHVRIGIVGTKSRKIKSYWHFHWRGEPFIAKTTYANTEVGAITAHRGDNAGAFDVTHWIHDRLTQDHGQVEKELVV